MNLKFVDNTKQIYSGVEDFNTQAIVDIPLAKKLVRQTSYWVCDPDTGNYGPGKFVGFSNMSIESYRRALEVGPTGFNGTLTREAIERVMGQAFYSDDVLSRGLGLWAEQIFGPKALDGIDSDKWSFLVLPSSQKRPTKFSMDPTLPSLLKNVGISQQQDGVRINKRFHDLFNPPGSSMYVSRGSRRAISIFFNGRAYPAHYVYEGTKDQSRIMQRIQFGAALKEEFKRVFPDQRGHFTIQAGADLNHFLFRVQTSSQQTYTEDLNRRVEQSRQDSQVERQKRLCKAPKNPATVQVTTTAFVRNSDVIAEALVKASGKCEGCNDDAPFMRASNGTPYLEVHHQVPLAQGGEDTVYNAVALCPNCHRKAHYG